MAEILTLPSGKEKGDTPDCPHKQLMIDTTERQLSCQCCGAELDWTVELLDFSSRNQKLHSEVQALRTKLAGAYEKIDDMVREVGRAQYQLAALRTLLKKWAG